MLPTVANNSAKIYQVFQCDKSRYAVFALNIRLFACEGGGGGWGTPRVRSSYPSSGLTSSSACDPSPLLRLCAAMKNDTLTVRVLKLWQFRLSKEES